MIKKHKNRWPEEERESAKNIGGLIKITIPAFGVEGKIATHRMKNTKIDDSIAFWALPGGAELAPPGAGIESAHHLGNR